MRFEFVFVFHELSGFSFNLMQNSWKVRLFFLLLLFFRRIKVYKGEGMAGHNESSGSEKKSNEAANDLQIFSAENLQSNLKIIYYRFVSIT